MRAAVVYESVFGNTHHVADAIADGLREYHEVTVLAVDEADESHLQGVDFLVVGGPTHAHMMATTSTKKQAAEDELAKAEKGLAAHEVDEHAVSESLRDWFKHLAKATAGHGAAFDTRFNASPLLTGRASKGIAKRLRSHGWRLTADPESFLVDKENELLDGELERATEWGRTIGAAVSA